MDFKGFMRECYLRSAPSIDLDLVSGKEDDKVDCTKHTLKMSDYDKILEEFGVIEDEGYLLACNMWMLQSGPQLENDIN